AILARRGRDERRERRPAEGGAELGEEDVREARFGAEPVEDRLHELRWIVNSPEDEAGGDDVLLAEGQELARGGNERVEPPVEPRDRLERRRKLELESGSGLHAHRPAELGNDRELSLTDRHEAQRGHPEAEEGQERDAARETECGQHSASTIVERRGGMIAGVSG